MSRSRRSHPATDHLVGQVLQDLAVPRPFTMAGFRSRLEECTGREVYLAASAMRSGSPSGIWLRTARADYLYYEERTSSFHQAHIVLHLSAHILLGGSSDGIFDQRLASGASSRLVGTILGAVEPSLISDSEAESFAYLALRPVDGSISAPAITKALRQLRPLHSALVSAVPSARRSIRANGLTGSEVQLYQTVLEIREAALALAPYRDIEVKAAAAQCGRVAGLSEDQVMVVAEAVSLVDAFRRSWAGAATGSAGVDEVQPTESDLVSEVGWLARVSGAFERLSLQGGRGCKSDGAIPGGEYPFGQT